VPVQPAALELLRDLSKVLARWGRWYVFGAQAVIAYGLPRLSADVDVTVQLVPEEPERFTREMQAAGSGLEDEFLDRARAVDVGGAIVPLIDPEDLIIAKVLAGRPKDMEDAHGLWRLRGRELDVGRIRGTLRLLEEALTQSDLLSAFESILGRASGSN
jgi:hypothetical protein